MRYGQICFTRISVAGSKEGWQTLNASPDLAHETVSAYEHMQNGNITAPAFDPEDESQQIVVELQSNEDTIFYSHIKCNLGADQSGRAIMFAHGFAFPLADFIRDPQDVLCVDESNFKFDASQTLVPPVVLQKCACPALRETALELDLTEKNYATLVMCVFSMLEGASKSTLHIICDCTLETIRKYMFCIYLALPFTYRKRTTFATYQFPNGIPKTIVPNRRINEESYYFDPKTGENNVVSEVVKRRWEKYHFMRVAPESLSHQIDTESYFEELEAELGKFSCADTTSLELYKMADDIMRAEREGAGSVPPEVLGERLNELLSAPVNHPYLDQQISFTLGEVIDSRIELHELIAEKLCRKLETTTNRDLIERGYLYNAAMISRMTVEDGARFLFNGYTDRSSESFLQIQELLNGWPEGRAILSYLYVELISRDLPNSAEDVISFFEETKTLADREQVQARIYEMSCNYLRTIIGSGARPLDLMLELNGFLHTVLNDRPDLVVQAETFAKETFWDCFDFAKLEIGSASYDEIALPSNANSELVSDVVRAYDCFVVKDIEEFNFQTRQLFSERESELTTENRDLLIKALQEACAKQQNLYGDYELDPWISVAYLSLYKRANPIDFLFGSQLKVMTTGLETSLALSEVLKDAAKRAEFVSHLSDYVKQKTIFSKNASEVLRIIKMQEKRAAHEEKRLKKEEKKSLKATKNAGGLSEYKNSESEDRKGSSWDDWTI